MEHKILVFECGDPSDKAFKLKQPKIEASNRRAEFCCKIKKQKKLNQEALILYLKKLMHLTANAYYYKIEKITLVKEEQFENARVLMFHSKEIETQQRRYEVFYYQVLIFSHDQKTYTAHWEEEVDQIPKVETYLTDKEPLFREEARKILKEKSKPKGRVATSR